MDKPMTSHELLASIAHSDMREGQVIIKIGGRWIAGHISEMTVTSQASSIPEFEIRGHVQS